MNRGWKGLMLAAMTILGAEISAGSFEARAQEQQPAQRATAATGETDTKKEPAIDAPPPRGAPEDPASRTEDGNLKLGLQLLRNLAEDQKAIWTSPGRLRPVDAEWLVPMAAAAGAMLATDTEYSKHLSNSRTRLKDSLNFSNFGIGALAGVGGGFYFWGRITHDAHKSETGILAGEAALDSYGVASVFKYSLGRERPLADDYRGNFAQGGTSMPSEHAAAAWSIASVVAHEYPGPLTAILAYGMASAVSASRVSAKQHFPSDVLIGSAIGWFVGQHVYRAHHDPELGGSAWESYRESKDDNDVPGKRAAPVGSPYVELDSWIYPALERLGALGYVHAEFLGMRPWTRIECAHLVEEAGEKLATEERSRGEVKSTYEALEQEFRPDLEAVEEGSAHSMRVESIYSRTMGIAGQPLHDGYHFGQTIFNDYGRPYAEGFNSVNGFSGWGTEGRFTVYVRGEMQYASSSATYSTSVRDAIATMDVNPVQPGTFPSKSQFELLDTYVAAPVADWNLSFGKQSLWWGPSDGTALLFSDNAEPIYMFRASRIAPIVLPWIFRWMGPLKVDAFYGKLSGNEFPARPLIHGEKITLKPLRSLEVGFTRTAEMGGVGRPLTLGALWHSYTGFFRSSALQANNENPGKRTGGLDVSWKPPYIGNWLALNLDMLSDDDPSPLAAMHRAGYDAGFYMPRVPTLPKLDLRFDAVNTDLPIMESHGGHFIYFDSFYHDLYTDKGNLIGSWAGREGTAFLEQSTYWLGARNAVVFGYRHEKVDADFVPSGGTVNDASARVNYWISREWGVSAMVQWEKWNFPLLAARAQTNWTGSVEIGFWPNSWSR
jgi:capsule assembly protein Wzi/PAP2 superfamily protein